MPKRPMTPVHYAAETVSLKIHRPVTGSALSYSLSTRKHQGRSVSGEILVNSTLHVPDEEWRLWTPAQTVYVVANELVLPGDEIWFTPGLY